MVANGGLSLKSGPIRGQILRQGYLGRYASGASFWPRRISILLGVYCLIIGAAIVAHGAEAPETAVRELTEKNRLLQQQVEQQQQLIDDLTAKVGTILKASDRHERELQGLQENVANITAPVAAPSSAYQRDNEVRISGEAGLTFFSTGSAGSFPKSTFRVDDARLFIEAPVMRDVYFYSELALATREEQEAYFQLGEIYVDFENVSGRFGGPAGLLGVRAGQIYTPFGEEYAVRNPISNPLISHSLSDVWGVDGGVELYGTLGAWQYAVTVQNGNGDLLHDHNADKAFAARLSWAPATWLNLSASTMRTGELKAYDTATPGDKLSNIWFCNGFFRALGPANSTGTFWASLWEGDAMMRWSGGHATAALGGVRYGDNDRVTDNSRQMTYGYGEVVQDVTREVFVAARYSQINAPHGYPLAGWGDMGRYFFAPSLTTGIDRLSLGFGYRFGPPLLVKFEFTRERGRLLNGSVRDHEDFLGAEVALKF